MSTTSHEHELPVQGVGPLDEVVADAAAGEMVLLTRNGQTVAAVVPPNIAAAAAREDAAAAVLAEFVGRFGAPKLEHYQQAFASLGVDWPGDEEIRQRYPVSAA